MKLFQKPKFLSDSDMQRIHEASIYLLEHKGVVFRSPEAREQFSKRGRPSKNSKSELEGGGQR